MSRQLISPKPHEAIRWGLQAWFTLEHYIPQRSDNPSVFAQSMAEVVIFISVFDMIKEIELTLKSRLEKYLRKTNGSTWWSLLPESVRRNAENRHRWAAGQLGARRVISRNNIAWLSMGDLLRSLNSLKRVEWQVCLDAENRRVKKFESVLRLVKSFRDCHLAHPKPRALSNSELNSLCVAVRTIPLIIRPEEWNRTLQLLMNVKALSPDDRREISSAAHKWDAKKRTELREWVACPELDNPERCTHERNSTTLESKWRECILTWCADLDAGGCVFFGRTD